MYFIVGFHAHAQSRDTIFPTRKAVKDAFAPLAKLLHSDKGGKDHLFAQAMTVKSRAMLHFQISTDAYSHSHDAFRAGVFEELCKKSPGAQEQHVAMWEFEQRQAVGTRYPATMFAGITLDAGMRETEKISPYCSVVFPPRKFLIKFL